MTLKVMGCNRGSYFIRLIVNGKEQGSVKIIIK